MLSLLLCAMALGPAHGACRVWALGQGNLPDTSLACPGGLLRHGDGRCERAYAWQDGCVSDQGHFYGAFADSFQFRSQQDVTCLYFDLTRTGLMTGSDSITVFLWADAGGVPGDLDTLLADVWVDPPVAVWPSVTRVFVPLTRTLAAGTWWIGFWGEWPGQAAQWLIGMDTSGQRRGRPMTYVAPGHGWSEGWHDVDTVFGLGRAATATSAGVVAGGGPGDEGACCYSDGACIVTTEENCQGEYMGDGTDCDPNPCPVPTTNESWGKIKVRYH